MGIDLGIPQVRAVAGGPLPSARPSTDALVDGYGRVATDLRVSLTDRCNLRCTYCMPEEGLEWMPRSEILDDAELVRLIAVGVERVGVTEVRFTGGEPLLRRGLEDLVAATAALRGPSGEPASLSMTTNGVGLARRAQALADAGLDRVNVSLDTLDPARFAVMTHRDRHADVLAGLRAAADAGLGPVKVNAVLLRGVNDAEAADLLRWSLREGYALRFIEQMPLEPHGAWDRDAMIDVEDVLALVRGGFERHELELVAQSSGDRGAAPAETWRAVWHDRGVVRTGSLGIIGSVTRPFCGACDRTRLTADGQVRDCLFSTSGHDLRELLRGGASDDELADAWRGAMWGKRAGHGLDDLAGAGFGSFARPDRPMSAIGG